MTVYDAWHSCRPWCDARQNATQPRQSEGPLADLRQEPIGQFTWCTLQPEQFSALDTALQSSRQPENVLFTYKVWSVSSLRISKRGASHTPQTPRRWCKSSNSVSATLLPCLQKPIFAAQRLLRPSSLLLLAAVASEDSCQIHRRRLHRSTPSASLSWLRRCSHQALTYSPSSSGAI